MTRETQRISYLDGLRGLAAMSVVGFHYASAYALPPGPLATILLSSPLSILIEGRAAVSFFFVLSGFVLALKYFRAADDRLTPISYLAYGVSRVGRIWIPYVVMVILSLMLKRYVRPEQTVGLIQTPWYVSLWTDPIGLKQFILETNLFVKWTRITLVPQAWSLYIEMTISLLVPVFALIARRSLVPLLLASALLVLSLNAPVFVVHFVLGIVMARFFSANTVSGLSWTTKSALMIGGIALYGFRVLGPAVGLPALPVDVTDCLNGVGAAALIWMTLFSPRMQATLNVRPIAHLGKVSYSIYLCHVALLLCVVPVFLATLARLSWTVPVLWSAALLLLIGATWLSAAVLHYTVEMPSIALAKRINRWIAVQVEARGPRRAIVSALEPAAKIAEMP